MIDSILTGSSGFIGSHLMAKLDGTKYPVQHRHIPGISEWLMPHGRFFFLSAYGNMAGQNDAAEIIRANIGDLDAVISRMLADDMAPKESFVYVSSSSVNLPVLTPYARAKRAAEEMLQATALPYCIIRPFSVTGVGEQSQHLIPTLIRSCMEGIPMDFVSSATHDYIDIDDVVDGLIWMSENKATGICEFGSGRPIYNSEVLLLVEEACGKKANINKVYRLRDYDTTNWYCKEPRWVAKKPLAQSIGEMVEAYRAK